MLTSGTILTIAKTKHVYLVRSSPRTTLVLTASYEQVAITIFEIGSLICAVAPRVEVRQSPPLLGIGPEALPGPYTGSRNRGDGRRLHFH